MIIFFRRSYSFTLLLTLVMLCPPFLILQSGQASQKEKKSSQPGAPILWRDPGAVETLDFVGGVTGRKATPQPPFTFVEESTSGSNPKIHVTDANGVHWTVKFGSEVNAETFATRMAWVVGYFVEPAYFVRSGNIQNVGKLTRAKSRWSAGRLGSSSTIMKASTARCASPIAV